MNFYRIVISITIGLIGLFGIGTLASIIWNSMLYGGDDWEFRVSFNKGGEGMFEIMMVTFFLTLYIIGIGYIIFDCFNDKKIKLKASEVFRKINYDVQQKYKSKKVYEK